ncbi:TlpA family protein disulfide reductase [Paenibacillus sp. SYP-B4298]|uniref:TlpA family protein disulfide reductase n=1 Tax=Paenibacillus sp. SYP-B4298 TaxID=2996034 RepID=UPI0022DDC92F|nr:TlpA disulfide reductase family protein [Paenibacillus sp. SYP-B4298]
MKKFGILATSIAVLILLFVLWNQNQISLLTSGQQAEAQPKPGYAAPVIELPGLDEQTYTAGGSHPKLLMVNFWASWCGPCELEAPDLVALYEKYGDKLELYGVNATFYDKERQARQFVTDFNLNFPILMDREGEATKLYKVSTFPTTLLIDRDGTVKERVVGVITREQWEKRIEALLQDEAGS